MGGFSSNYEGGYLDFDENPKWMANKGQKEHKYAHLKQKKVYHARHGAKTSYLNVMLSSSSLLNETQQEKRAKLCQIDDEDIELTVHLNKKEVEIYHEDVFIGRVQKLFEEEGIDNTDRVNQFCFNGDEAKKIEAFWDGESFFLKHKR